MLENIKYSVVVLLNNDVWGVWELPGKPERTEEYAIRKAISDSLEDNAGKFSVEFIQTIPADNVKELIAGLKESIENEIGYG